jgi:hypothetical protein
MITRRHAARALVSMFGAAPFAHTQGPIASDAAQIDWKDPLFEPVNVMDFAPLAKAKLDPVAWDYLDGGSEDETPRIAESLGCETLRAAPSRGGQMRVGASRASSDVILFVHADTLLPPTAGHAILNCFHDATLAGGGFWKRYRPMSLPLLGARFKCFLRLACSRRILGDQGLLVRRAALDAIEAWAATALAAAEATGWRFDALLAPPASTGVPTTPRDDAGR